MKLGLDGLASLESAMAFHRDRHLVLAGNLANLDTPGFVPFDLVQPNPGTPPAGEVMRTHQSHLAAVGADATHEVVTDERAPARPDGNRVALERELAKLDANRVRYMAASELVSRRLALLRYAAGDGT